MADKTIETTIKMTNKTTTTAKYLRQINKYSQTTQIQVLTLSKKKIIEREREREKNSICMREQLSVRYINSASDAKLVK